MTRPPVRARTFVRIAADIIEVPPAMILGPSRRPYLVAARWIGMAMAHRHGHSHAAIGRAFHRDPTTVAHAVHKVSGRT